jgi:hypothetical protein
VSGTTTDSFNHSQMKKLGCHEFGHTTGLIHESTNVEVFACMILGHYGDNPPPSNMGTHNFNHIQQYYPQL